MKISITPSPHIQAAQQLLEDGREYNVSYEEVDQYTVKISGNCVFSGEEYSFMAPKVEFEAYLKINEISVMGSVGPEERDFLLMGVSPKGYDEVMNKFTT